MSENTLRDQIQAAMKHAMRAQEKAELGVIRLILAEIKQVEVDERITLDDAQILLVLDKMLKQRRESIKQYESAYRQDLAEKEQAEIIIIQKFMPEPLTEGEIQDVVSKAIEDANAQTIKDMGKVMALIKPHLQGKADMGAVGALVKGMLSA